MKKVFLSLLLAVILAVAAVPFSGPFPKYAVGKTVGDPIYTHPENSFSAVVDRVPILAEVEITQYKGSLKNSTGYSATLFLAEVVTCYKNTTGKELSIIQLVQDGTQDFTFSGYPLFQTGDRLLLPLAPAFYFGADVAEKLDGCYLIDGAILTALQIVESEDGDACRTFLPTLLDLPADGVTANMQSSARINVQQKHIVPSDQSTPSYPEYTVVSYARLKTFIEDVLGK